MTIAEILAIVEQILALEKKVEVAIASEKDMRRREKLQKACKERDLDAIRSILFQID